MEGMWAHVSGKGQKLETQLAIGKLDRRSIEIRISLTTMTRILGVTFFDMPT